MTQTLQQSIFKPAAAEPLVPGQVLAHASKILFITHFAIGDFAYMQSCFRALKRAWPGLDIHIWVDERRRTADATQWPHLQKYGVYDWVNASPWVDKCYDRTWSPALNAASIAEAKGEDYPVIVVLTNLDSHRYARLARTISSRAFIVGLRKVTTRSFNIVRRLGYRQLNAVIPLHKSVTYSESGAHISDIYADWFARAFGIAIPRSERFPDVDIPPVWMEYAHQQFASWGFDDGSPAPVIFVNTFSKCIDRCWPLERAFELIQEMRRDAKWQDARFIVNVVPEELERARRLHAASGLAGTQLFSASQHFFQLPAILRLCSLIVTVETVVMHLANAVGVPVIAFMRQTTPEWKPIDSDNSAIIVTKEFGDWLDRLEIAEVVETVKTRGGMYLDHSRQVDFKGRPGMGLQDA